MKNILIALKHYLIDVSSLIIHEMGFEGFADLSKSLFNTKLILYSTNFIIVWGAISKVLTDYLGLEVLHLVAFTMLITMQFITGIKVALSEGEKVQENKILRILVRLSIYSCILFIMNSFRSMQAIELGAVHINTWDYLFHFGVAVIILQLLISLFKNLSKLGFDEVAVLGDFLGRKLHKLIEIDKNGINGGNKLTDLENNNNDTDKKI